MLSGAKFVLSSGRMPRALQGIGEALQVNAPAVCYNGGAAVDLFTGETVYKTPVPMALAVEIAKAAEDMNLYFHAFIHGSYIAPEYNALTEAYEKLCGVKAQVMNARISESLDEEPMKLLILDTPEGAQKALPVLKAKFEGRASLMQSQKHMIECVDVNTSKAGALENLSGLLGIDRSEAIAFGDGQNDLEMLKWAGESYVMENASDAVKHAEPRFKIAPSNAEDGVAQVIETLLKEGKIGG